MGDVSWLFLILAAAAGAGLGVVFFGGLWWTVHTLADAKHPALLSLGSFAARTGVVVAGLYWVMGSDWKRGVAAILGFAGARVVLVHWLGK